MRTTPPVIATFIWASVAHSSAMLNALVTTVSCGRATAVPFARQRVAMDCAAWLARRLASVDYRAEYAAWRAEIDAVPKSEWVDRLWSTRTIRAMRQFCSGETDNQSLWGAAWAHQLSIQLAHGRRHAAVSDQS